MKFNIDFFEAISLNIRPEFNNGLKIDFIKPIDRRKLSVCSKLCLSIAQNNTKLPIVFSSFNAEINRCFKLLQSLESGVSPASFSLSVLNATPALISIHSQNHSQILAISSAASVEEAVITALGLGSALVLSYEENLGDENGIALGMIVSQGDKFSLDFKENNQNKTKDSQSVFLDNFGKNRQWSYFDGCLEWIWHENS